MSKLLFVLSLSDILPHHELIICGTYDFCSFGKYVSIKSDTCWDLGNSAQNIVSKALDTIFLISLKQQTFSNNFGVKPPNRIR